MGCQDVKVFAHRGEQPKREKAHLVGSGSHARLGEQLPRLIHRSILRFELGRSEPDLLRLGVGLEGVDENEARAGNVPVEPLFLGCEEP